MQIQLNSKVFVKAYGGKANESNTTQHAVVDFEVTCDREQARKMLGDGLAVAAFAGYVQEFTKSPDGDAIDGVWKTKSLKPSSKVVAEMHQLTIDGEITVADQPEIFKISPVQDAERVIVTLRVEIAQHDADARHYLDDRRGQQVKLTVKPAQGEMFEEKESLPGVE